MTIPSNTFTLPISANATDYTDFAHAFVSHLGEVSVCVYSHEIDAGDLGQLEIDLEDIDVDLSECVSSYTISNAIENVVRGGGCGEDFTQEVTLTQVREAYCKEHDCNPYEYLANVAEEITDTAMVLARASVETEYQHKARQEDERAQASVEADKLVVEQALEDRNNLQVQHNVQSSFMHKAIELLNQASSQMRDPSGGMSFMSEDEQLRDTTSKQIREFLEQSASILPETETETTPETTTDSTDAEA
jgi:hypothetical protein